MTATKFTLSSGSLSSLSKEYGNNVYSGNSARNCCRDEKEQSETWAHLQSIEHKILSNKEWLAFFHNIKMKQNLIILFVTYLSADDFSSIYKWGASSKQKNEKFEIL